jgi:hypothetical protein
MFRWCSLFMIPYAGQRACTHLSVTVCQLVRQMGLEKPDIGYLANTQCLICQAVLTILQARQEIAFVPGAALHREQRNWLVCCKVAAWPQLLSGIELLTVNVQDTFLHIIVALESCLVAFHVICAASLKLLVSRCSSSR